MKNVDVKYIKNKDIDMILWDKCISRAYNGDVFAYSWYLDSVCNNWDALIIDNYKAVLPLPEKKYMGISGVVLPKYLNKTNLYISNDSYSELKSNIFLYFPKKYKFLNIETESQNMINVKFKYSEKRSFRIDLISPYTVVQKSYSDNYKEQINISVQNKIFYNTGILPNGLVLLSSVSDKLRKKDGDKLRLLSAISLRKNLGEIYGAFNEHNRLIAAVLFINSHYITNIIAAYQTKEAQNKKALYGLIDYYIKMHSEKAITLDFFGLNSMPLDFYKGIRAKEYPYFNIRKKFLF